MFVRDVEHVLMPLLMMLMDLTPILYPLSLVPEQAKYRGISFPELVAWMVENARCDA